jgi:hypothetical protein
MLLRLCYTCFLPASTALVNAMLLARGCSCFGVRQGCSKVSEGCGVQQFWLNFSLRQELKALIPSIICHMRSLFAKGHHLAQDCNGPRGPSNRGSRGTGDSIPRVYCIAQMPPHREAGEEEARVQRTPNVRTTRPGCISNTPPQ